MKIIKISIKNYRSCLSASFAPDQHLSALIGPNGSGKTNVLSAIRLLPSLCYMRTTRHSLEDVPATSLSEIKTWYEIDGKKLVHTARLNLVTNEKNQDEIINAEESWYMYEFTGKKSQIAIPSWILFDVFRDNSILSNSSRRNVGLNEYLVSQGLTPKDTATLVDVVKAISNISYYSASQFTNPASCPISFEVEGDNKRRTGISITGHKKFLYDLYQEHRNANRWGQTPLIRSFYVDPIEFEQRGGA